MSDRPATIAETADALTPAWLTEALRSSGVLDGGSVATVEAQPLGTGQMCDSVRLRLTYEGGGGPETMVAKLPASDPTSRTTAINLSNYVKEVRFYTELADALSVRTPAVHYADLSDDGGSFVLLLEDLAPAEQGDQLTGCSAEVAAMAMHELVGLHAPRWGDSSLEEVPWLHTDPEQAKAAGLMLFPMLWEGFQERYDAQLTDEVRTAGSELFGHLEPYLTPTGDPLTVTHGDFRLDNLLIHEGAGTMAVVDWQTCALGRGPSDVAYFIGAGLLAEDRRAHEEALVRAYHEALTEAGVDYPWDRCWEAYRLGTFAGLIMAVGASMLVERTDRGDAMFMAMASRHAQHILDLEAIDLLTG
ncbi:MAG: phosphotransferase family protein [Actinomycetota bacterium]